ncbi:protein kinase domain-containing protein [Tundrisphaera lichenicola]|uniref:serine/threonine-protein kinase n=1 Tax=Tundrisphaera lichenicola TaxID=2029860 RepID=UPI003EBE9512
MIEIDLQSFLDQATLIGLITRDQAAQAREDATDGSVEAVARILLRQDILTAWQVEKLKKGELSGFYYGGAKVLFHIAEGTFARVYRGRKMPGNQSVAIKVLRNRFVSDAGAVSRFNQEAESGLRLVHPNIVRIYEYGEADKRYYMIMEFVEGSNLRDFLRIRGRLTPTEALPLMLGLANGLKYSLEQGVTHRDLKATNILIASNGQAKLVDFGLATIDDDRRMAAAHGQRTVDYSALERTCGSPKGDKRSDIFFLGCVFYQMLTGQLPLPEVETDDPLKKMLKRGINSIKPLSEQRHAPDPELTEIIEKMMKVDLKQRYLSMDQVVEDLDVYLERLAMKAAGYEPPRTTSAAKVVESEEEEYSAVEEEDSAEETDASDEEGEELDEIPVFEQPPEPDDVFASPEFEVKAFVQKKLLCVEVQEEVQKAFRKTLSKMGYRILIVSDAERAAERYRESPTDGVLFDADGLGPQAIDHFLEMQKKAEATGQAFLALVLLGPRQHYLVKKLSTNERLIVLPKPVKMKDIQSALERLVPAGQN